MNKILCGTVITIILTSSIELNLMNTMRKGKCKILVLQTAEFLANDFETEHGTIRFPLHFHGIHNYVIPV